MLLIVSPMAPFSLVSPAGGCAVGPDVPIQFALERFMEAYDVFADPAHSGALKVVVSR